MLSIEPNPKRYDTRLVTSRAYAADQLIQSISQYQITDRPTDSSIQVGIDTHWEELGIFTFHNHFCDRR